MSWTQFLQTIHSYLLNESLLPPGSRVLAAVSGGVDSVLMFLGLAALRPSLQLAELAVVYVDHGLRPQQTPEEALWVNRLAQQHGCRCFVRKVHIDRSGGSLQAAAREARRHSLEQLLKDELLDFITTGHHADDQAETLMLRLLRGTGPQGLGGIAPKRGKWVRPLLAMRREELLQVAQEKDIAWLEDPSNASYQFTRNRVRHELFPSLEATYNPRLRESLSRLASQMQQDNECLEQLLDQHWTEALVRSSEQGWRLSLPVWDTLPTALQRRALKRLVSLASQGHDLTTLHIDALTQLAHSRQGEKTISLPGQLCAVRQYNHLTLSLQSEELSPPQSNFEIKIDGPGTYTCPAGVLHITKPGGSNPKMEEKPPCWTIFLNETEAEEFPWILRNRKAGDRLDFGTHHRPLKKWMIDAKIPKSLRYRLPLLERQGSIGWVIGWPPAPPFQSKPSAQALLLHFTPTRPVLFSSATSETNE